MVVCDLSDGGHSSATAGILYAQTGCANQPVVTTASGYEVSKSAIASPAGYEANQPVVTTATGYEVSKSAIASRAGYEASQPGWNLGELGNGDQMFYDFLNTTSHASFIVHSSDSFHQQRQQTTDSTN